jgi:hypothetical protein
MSTSDTLFPSDAPEAPLRPKNRSRFAGARFGAWLFAASFSVGMWGLALKILSPSRPETPPASAPLSPRLAPRAVDEGERALLWGPDASNSADGYPVTGSVPVIALGDPDKPNVSHD